MKDWVRTEADNKSTNPIDSMPSPRFVKTHLPFAFLPPNLLDTCKVVYVARNPKDVAVSSYFHHKLTRDFDTTLSMEEYFEYFMNGDGNEQSNRSSSKNLTSTPLSVFYTPIWTHLLQAWNKRHHPNLLFLFYEDLKAVLYFLTSHADYDYTAPYIYIFA